MLVIFFFFYGINGQENKPVIILWMQGGVDSYMQVTEGRARVEILL